MPVVEYIVNNAAHVFAVPSRTVLGIQLAILLYRPYGPQRNIRQRYSGNSVVFDAAIHKAVQRRQGRRHNFVEVVFVVYGKGDARRCHEGVTRQHHAPGISGEHI